MTRDAVLTGQVAALVAGLTAVEGRLRRLGDDHWANWLERDRRLIAQGDAYGLEHLMQALGGMGSINDAYPHDDGDVGGALADIYRSAAQLLAEYQAGAG